MIERTTKIVNKLGMHLRAAAVFIEAGNRFRCQIYLRKGHRQVNAKSIMGLMTVGAALGSEVTVVTDGEDEVEALETLVRIIENRFGEKE